MNIFGWGKRLFLFMTVNILVVLTISIVLSVLGVQPYLSARGLDYGSLMTYCLVWGFGGAFISLAISRMMAKWMMGVKVIDPETMRDQDARWLVETVHRLARKAGLQTMPEVGVYESPEVNAFATGPTRNRALVAVSAGLLQRMDRNQAEGVLGHELAHVANGDMVTMALVQGVVNAFVMFFARIVAFAIAENVEERQRRMVRYLVTFLFEIAFSFLGMFVVAGFSRYREFRADAGGANLAGRDKMIGALEALQRVYAPKTGEGDAATAVLKISGKTGGLMALLATHPPLEVRIARLRGGQSLA